MKNFAQHVSVLRVAAVVSLAASCGGPFEIERDAQAPIQTDQLRYRIERADGFAQTTVGYRYTNGGPTSIFIANCHGITLIRLERDMEGVWQGIWGNSRPDCASPPIEIAPGASIERSIVVAGGFAGCGCAPQFGISDLEGVYRLVLEEVWDSLEEVGAPEAQSALVKRLSNPFHIED